MRIGKLTSEELNSLIISKTSLKNAEVVQSAGVAEDCCAIKSQDTLLLTTDPITATGKNSGKLAILISANDIAVSGGTPKCALLTVIAPTDYEVEGIGDFMSEAYTMAEKLNIDIIGGHTEFSSAVNRLVVNCTMIGTTNKVVKTGGAKSGDHIIMTKWAGIEGTSIIANDHIDKLKNAGISDAEIEEAQGYIDNISVLEDARIATQFDVHSMHDITEGGLYGAVSEMCEASGLGATIDADKIPVTSLTKKICDVVNVSPMRLIGSGSMLIVASDGEAIVSALERGGIKATIIGRMHEGKEVTAIGSGTLENLNVAPDELLLIK